MITNRKSVGIHRQTLFFTGFCTDSKTVTIHTDFTHACLHPKSTIDIFKTSYKSQNIEAEKDKNHNSQGLQ